jgi:hypothetical protein
VGPLERRRTGVLGVSALVSNRQQPWAILPQVLPPELPREHRVGSPAGSDGLAAFPRSRAAKKVKVQCTWRGTRETAERSEGETSSRSVLYVVGVFFQQGLEAGMGAEGARTRGPAHGP